MFEWRLKVANDITKDIEFNDMLGFNKEDVKYLMKEIDIPEEKQEEVLPIIFVSKYE